MIDNLQALHGSVLPAIGDGQWGDLLKAIQAGSGTDLSQLTGGAALRWDSLDPVLVSVTQKPNHFTLWNKLPKDDATAVTDGWTTKDDVGTFPGAVFLPENGDLNEETSDYTRHIGEVKFLSMMRGVTLQAILQKGQVKAQAEEEVSGTMSLLTGVEWASFHGDSSINTEEFDGLSKVLDAVGGYNVLDMRGDTLFNAPQTFLNAAAVISDYGNYGQATDVFMSKTVQADLDMYLDPAWRVQLDKTVDGGVRLGAPVRGIRTSEGDLVTNTDRFLSEKLYIPAEAYTPRPKNRTVNPTKPAGVAGVRAADAASQFAVGQDGNFYYAVASVNRNGESDLVKTGQIAVQVGDKVTLTITQSAAVDETGYAIYRSRRNGANASGDFRLIKRIARNTGGNTTTFVDYNADIPGTSKVFVLDMSDSSALVWRKLAPMGKFILYPTSKLALPWAQFMFGYLRVTVPKRHVMIKNVLSTQAKAAWSPF